MAAPFAVLEDRAQRAAARHLANAEMVFADGTVAVLFGRADPRRLPEAMGGQRTLVRWQASAPTADFDGIALARDHEASIDGVVYVVTELDSDAGWTTLTLRRAS